MKTCVILPCCNQEEIVRINIEKLKLQSVQPDMIVVINDHSLYFTLQESNNIKILNSRVKGRSSTRNLGIEFAYQQDMDIIIFMDGDTIPENNDFIKNHLDNYINKNVPKIVFGTRTHIPRPNSFRDFNDDRNYSIKECELYPSDLLTGNLDNLIKKRDLDNRDLRIIAGITKNFNEAKDFNDKTDLILSGMVTWSCNFSMNKKSLEILHKFMMDVHNIEGYFDTVDFNDGWGYEDGALGLDAHFAGIQIEMSENCNILHFIHDRSDDFQSHIIGRHKILVRYRKLLKILG